MFVCLCLVWLVFVWCGNGSGGCDVVCLVVVFWYLLGWIVYL